MDTIPYEILQLVASNLLPRHQCRLALASKYHYQCLYTPLLRWHARKYCIQMPKYKYINCADRYVSLLQHNNKIVAYEYGLCLFEYDYDPCNTVFYNLTDLYMASVGEYVEKMEKVHLELLFAEINYQYPKFFACYAFMNKLAIITHINADNVLIYCPYRVFDRIISALTDEDADNLQAATTMQN